MTDNLGVSGRISRYFVDSQLTPLIALVAMLLGLFAVLVTPREEEPQINVTMANVLVPFPGASAKDVESLVATPAEQVLSQITGIEHVFSVSKPGMAVLTVQFKVGEDRTQALVRLYDTIYSNKDWLSPNLGVGEPIIKPMGIDDVPIVTLTLWTADPQRGSFDLERIAHAAEVELKRVPGTRVVQTIGGPGRSLRVLLDSERMHSHGVTAQDVRGALLAANVSLPAGSLIGGSRETVVETGIFLASAQDVKRLAVGSRQGRPVFIEDVARVVDGPEQPGRYVWFGAGAASAAREGKGPAPVSAGSEFPAVTIAISKKAGENAVDVAEHLVKRVDQIKGSVIPEGVSVALTRNYGETANDKAMKLIQKLIFATLSVVALVWAALGRREATIVGAAVILTLAATLFASWAWGFTLNRVSLFALIFSIGILVDDAIVVVENIHRHRAFANDTLALMIPLAVDEVGGPTILATFTVIAALLPMAFVSGLMGPYMSPIPINASMGMVISLAVAFVVTPWLAARMLGKHHPPQSEGETSSRAMRLFERVIKPFLRGAEGGAARRTLWIAVIVLIGASMSLAAVKLVILKMLPFDNKSEFQVVVDMPTGTALEETSRVLHEMGGYLATVPEVTDYQAYAGTSAPINFNGLVRQYYLRALPELGDIQVNLVDKHRRDRKSHDIAAAVRPQLEAIGRQYGATVKVVEVPPGPPVLSPIVAEVYGPDYGGQLEVAQSLRELFARTPDIVDVDNSVEETAPKIVLRVDQRKAAIMGVTQRDIVQTLRAALAGEEVTPILGVRAKYEIPVKISLPPEKAGSIETLMKLRVRAQDGNLVPISELVLPAQAQREKTIYHKDLLPVAYVVADMAGKLDSPLYGMFGMRGEIAKLAAPQGGTSGIGEYFIRQPEDPYAGYAIKWDGEWQVTYETFRDMGIAYAVGLILIYLLVVAQFRSYTIPLVIMAPIPLTIVGVMPGHALLGAQFTATSMIGMIALAGIIVRNSILLVDFINLEASCGTDFQQAVIKAAATRAKPIVLTGLAAMLGAFFILDDPIFNGLAVSLIFGIFVSTILTLVVIPVLYYALRWKSIAVGVCETPGEAG